MDDDSTRQSVLFSDLSGKPVVAKCDQQHAGSDGGTILPQACDQRLGLTEALIGGIDDRRQSVKIRHTIGDLVRQRMYASACGYPDGNDAGRFGADPIQKRHNVADHAPEIQRRYVEKRSIAEQQRAASDKQSYTN